MKRTNQKSMFATYEHKWDKVELCFELYDVETGRDIECEILQAEFMYHDDESNEDWFLVEYMPPEVAE
jgi:hypothetical protein